MHMHMPTICSTMMTSTPKSIETERKLIVRSEIRITSSEIRSW